MDTTPAHLGTLTATARGTVTVQGTGHAELDPRNLPAGLFAAPEPTEEA